MDRLYIMNCEIAWYESSNGMVKAPQRLLAALRKIEQRELVEQLSEYNEQAKEKVNPNLCFWHSLLISCFF